MGPSPSSKLRSAGGKSGSPVKAEPFEHLIQHIKQTDPMLYEALKRLTSVITNVVNQNIANLVTPDKLRLQRTLLLRDTTVGNDVADHVEVYGIGGPYTATTVYAVLRKVITADLTVRINLISGGVSSTIGKFTVPLATKIDQVLTFTIAVKLQDKDVFIWDVTASDGSKDTNGVASFTIIWS